MIHVAPWAAAEGLLAGAARYLRPGGGLYLYGPFKREGRHTAPSNADFDAGLRAQDPAWGVRDLEMVADLAAAQGFAAPLIEAMPARSEEHTSELQSLMRISYAVFCLKKKKYSIQSYQSAQI